MGDVDAKAQKLLVGVDEKLNLEGIKKHLLVHAPKDKKELRERDGREVAAEERGRPTALGAEWGKQSGLSLSGHPLRRPSIWPEGGEQKAGTATARPQEGCCGWRGGRLRLKRASVSLTSVPLLSGACPPPAACLTAPFRLSG